MTSLFPDLRADLVGAMERGPRSRRTPVTLAVAALVAALAIGATTIHRPARPAATPTPTPTPLPQLPPAIAASVSSPPSRLAPGSPILQLRVSDGGSVSNGGVQWDVAAWGTTTGTISLTQAAAHALRPHWGITGRGTFPMASSLLAGPLAGLSVGGARKYGSVHYVVTGIVESRATGVTVTLAGQRQTAVISAAVLTRPVIIDPAGLTPSGRKLAKTLPREVSVRLFAAAFEFHEPEPSLQPLIRVTRPDGTSREQLGARYSVGLPYVG